jgi:hypothetical protein
MQQGKSSSMVTQDCKKSLGVAGFVWQSGCLWVNVAIAAIRSRLLDEFQGLRIHFSWFVQRLTHQAEASIILGDPIAFTAVRSTKSDAPCTPTHARNQPYR